MRKGGPIFSEYWIKKCNIDTTHMYVYKKCKALRTILRWSESDLKSEYITKHALDELFDYVNENHYIINGDMLIIDFAKYGINELRYYEVFLPIK